MRKAREGVQGWQEDLPLEVWWHIIKQFCKSDQDERNSRRCHSYNKSRWKYSETYVQRGWSANRYHQFLFAMPLGTTHLWFYLSDRTFLRPSSWRWRRTPLISPLNYNSHRGQYDILQFDSINQRLQQPRRIITAHTVDEKPKATPKTPHIISSTIKTGRLPNRSASGAYIGADKDSVTIITDSYLKIRSGFSYDDIWLTAVADHTPTDFSSTPMECIISLMYGNITP